MQVEGPGRSNHLWHVAAVVTLESIRIWDISDGPAKGKGQIDSETE